MILALLLAPVLAAAEPASPPAISSAVWVNTPGPLTLTELRGRVVILEFSDEWSGESERGLRKARAAYARHSDAAALVGVRTRAAGDEGGRAALEREALRRDIVTPLVEDPGAQLARAYGVSSLPAQVVLDARGRFVRRFSGGGEPEALAAAVDELVAQARKDFELWTATGPAAPVLDGYTDLPLAFPTGLAYDPVHDRLIVSDTGHNRVVVSDGGGRVLRVVGNGAADDRDGPAAAASFDHPGAAVFIERKAVVADPGNGLTRLLDADGEGVTRWFADKAQTWPTGLAWSGGVAYLAYSGARDIWALDLAGHRSFLFAGDGKAGDHDGLAPVARFRDPSALATLNGTLFIAEPGAGRLRSIDLSTPTVVTVRLSGPGAPLRHPTALAALGGRLFIADAGDGCVKELDPASGSVRVVTDGLSRPSGLAVVHGELIVAETDRSRLLRLAPDGRRLGELALRGLKPLPKGPPMTDLPERQDETLAPQRVKAGVEDAIELSVELPAGDRLNPRAPLRARIEESRGNMKFPPETRRFIALPPPKKPLRIRFTPAAGSGEALIDVDLYYCRADGKGLCFASAKRYHVFIDAAKDAAPRTVRIPARP
jgi:hypothetical protein